MKKKGKEISVKKAAQSLRLSERTVLNFIKQKKLEAIKVGRDWFIDYASFVSFALKYDIPISERDESLSEKFGNIRKVSETNGDFSEISERFDNSNKTFPKTSEMSADFSEKSETFPKLSETRGDFSENFRNIPKDSEKSDSLSERFELPNKLDNNLKPSLKRPNHITSLRVYELSKVIFSNHNFKFSPENKMEERLIDLSFQTLEGIGSGFYAYSWDEKKFHYGRARSSAGALMALISSREIVLPDISLSQLLWSVIVSHKKYAEAGAGIPIGNLTSQLFANFYLSAVDKVICDSLGLKYKFEEKSSSFFIRYMDDFLIISDEKSLACKTSKVAILHSRARGLDIPIYKRMHLSGDPIPFLGYLVSCNGITPLARNKRKIKRKLRRLEKVDVRESYKAMVKNSYDNWSSLKL